MTEKKTVRKTTKTTDTAGKRKTTAGGKTSSSRATTTTPRRRSTAAASPRNVSAEELYRMIAETAYYIAESRGFCGGCPQQDWLQAEREVMARLAA